MKAKIEKVNPAIPQKRILEQAVRLIKKGEVVVCPTDTGYAFSANALDTRAVARVFHLKGRSFSNPIHIAVGSIEQAGDYASVDKVARFLADHYLPGALTLVMRKKETVPSMLVAGMDSVGIRIPDNEVMLQLIKMTGFPLTTTSANVSGRPTPYSVDEIINQLGDSIDEVALILDQGPLRVRDLSTIVDLTVSPPQLIRQGLISWLEIREVLKRFLNPEE
jgi:L-threonylcarbamoyladenylate synthase